MIWLLLFGCLERVTGDAVPLDPRFIENQPGAAGGADGGDDGGGTTPFADHDGEMVWVRGEIIAEKDVAVDLDVRVPDPTVDGGARGMGKLLLEGPGAFELKVPKSLGPLELQAFQDPDSDGPSEDDAFGEVDLEVEAVDVEGVVLTLEVGARAGPTHVEAPPGAGSDQAPPPQGDQPHDGDPFEGMDGPFTQVSGIIYYQGDGMVDLDIFQTDPSVPGGRKLLGKLKRKAGAFSLAVPVELGRLEIEAMVDLDADGPSGSDPQSSFEGNPIDLSDGDVDGVNLSLAIAEEPAPAPVAPGVPENLSLDEEFAATEEAAGTKE